MLPRSLRSNLSAFLDRREIDELLSQPVRQWPICDHDIIRQRYDRIAAFIPILEWAFFMPSGFRKRAVDQLKLRRGDRVLEVGCGTGRNFPYLREARTRRPDLWCRSIQRNVAQGTETVPSPAMD
jgi:hypothetical protein